MTYVRPTMLYATECWDVKEKHIYKMSLDEMRILRQTGGNTKKCGI